MAMVLARLECYAIETKAQWQSRERQETITAAVEESLRGDHPGGEQLTQGEDIIREVPPRRQPHRRGRPAKRIITGNGQERVERERTSTSPTTTSPSATSESVPQPQLQSHPDTRGNAGIRVRFAEPPEPTHAVRLPRAPTYVVVNSGTDTRRTANETHGSRGGGAEDKAKYLSPHLLHHHVPHMTIHFRTKQRHHNPRQERTGSGLRDFSRMQLSQSSKAG
jgi:hypothetical protein